MKFQSLSAFEKHLSCSELPRSFLLVSPCDDEKRLWVETIIERWKRKEPQLEVFRLSTEEASPDAIKQAVCSPNLWGGMRAIVINGVDSLKGFQLSPPPDVVLIFLSKTSKMVPQAACLLDVSGEKPWDRDRRVQDWIREKVRKDGKEIASDATFQLISLLGTDFGVLDQEINKLLTYAQSKKNIDSKDVRAICGSRDLSNGWQLAETLVWKHPIALHEKMCDLGFVFPFLGQVRYHLQLGAQLAELLEKKNDPAVHLPSIRPQMLTKFAPIAMNRKFPFFLKGLLNLYEFEFSAKSSSIDLKVMFDLFQAKIYEETRFTT